MTKNALQGKQVSAVGKKVPGERMSAGMGTWADSPNARLATRRGHDLVHPLPGYGPD